MNTKKLIEAGYSPDSDWCRRKRLYQTRALRKRDGIAVWLDSVSAYWRNAV